MNILTKPTNYQIRWPETKTAQAMTLSVDTIKSLLLNAEDVPGQSYMYEGTYWTEVKRLQGLPHKKLNELLQTFYSLYSAVGQILKNEPILTPLGANNIDAAAADMIRTSDEYQFQSWPEVWKFMRENKIDKFSPQFMWAFTDSINIDGLTKENVGNIEVGNVPVIKKHMIELNRKIDAVAPLLVRSGAVPKSEYDAFKKTLGDVAKKLNGRISDFYDKGIEHIGECAAHAYAILSKENQLPGRRVQEPMQFPWIDEKAFMNAIKKHFPKESIAYFFQRPELRHGLLAKAQEDHKKKERDAFEYDKVQIDHAAHPTPDRPGTDNSYITWLARPFHPDGLVPVPQERELFEPITAQTKADPRLSIATQDLFNFANALQEHCNHIVGGCVAANIIHAHLAAIQMQAVEREDLWHLFQENLEYVPKATESEQGLKALEKYNFLPLPPPFQTQNVSQARSAITRHVQRMRERSSDKGRIFEERWYQMTPDELERLKNLRTAPTTEYPEGMPIWESDKASAPFSYQYQVRRERFPGSSWTKFPENTRTFQFVIDIAPSLEVLKSPENPEGIPKELLQELHLHPMSAPVHPDPEERIGPDQYGGKGKAGISPLGWVGGFIDMDTRTMWISEVQSDIMQSTVYMRDPAKVESERQQRRIELERQVSQKENQLNQAQKPKADPRAGLKQKINRIRGEQAGLDPNSAKYQNNERLITTLTDQLSKIPESVGAGIDETRIQQIQTELEALKSELADLIAKGTSLNVPAQKRWRLEKGKKWHDYRNKVERIFDDWGAIFFNTVLREAKRNRITRVNVTTAKSLMAIWGKVCQQCGEDLTPNRGQPEPSQCPNCGAAVTGAGFARPETKILFQRIYDNNARKQGAKEIKERGKTWWQINMSDPNLRIAQKWFMRYKFF